MQVQVVPLTDFVHGPILAHEGRPLPMEEGLAHELERKGLVRIKMAPEHANKMKGTHENKGKAQDDGAGPLSSASPADPASVTKTLRLRKPGAGKPPKADT